MHRRSPGLVRPFLTAVALVATIALTAGPAAAAPAAPAAPTVPGAPALPAALDDSGPFEASAEAALVTLEIPSLSPALLPSTSVDLARSIAGADSDADLDGGRSGAQRTVAAAGTAGDTALLGAPIDIQTTTASAPESQAFEDILLPIDAAPLLDVTAVRTTAEANWLSDAECVAGDVPLSRADQSLADLTLLEIAPGQSLVELDTDDGDGAADSEAGTYLAPIDGPGDNRAVQARATTNITNLDLFNELAGPGTAFGAQVVQAPNWTASASGLPGGATVTGPQPVVAVELGEEDPVVLDSYDETAEATVTNFVLGDLVDLESADFLANLLNDLGLGGLIPVAQPVEEQLKVVLSELQPVVRLSMPVDIVEAADGTHASVEASLLRIEVLPPGAVGAAEPLADLVNQILGALTADISQPLLTLDLGPTSASATAPAGGIDCAGDPENPLRELNKHASALEVAAGGTFDYNISVPNRGPCTVTDVVVTDTITGPAGFEVVGTEPAATVAGGTVTFDVGDLAPNETVNLTITVRVPADAPDGATFDDVVTATGTCDGTPVEEDDRLDDVPVVRRNFEGDCSVQFSNKDASHLEVMPGQTFSYYVHAFNSGARACDDVTIVDTLDDRVSFVGCNRGCTNDGQAVTWTIDTIPGGSSVVLSVVVQVADDATGTLANTAVITPSNGTPVTVTSNGPVITDQSLPKDPSMPERGLPGARAPQGPLPRTGAAVPGAVAGLLGAAGLALAALRRRTA